MGYLAFLFPLAFLAFLGYLFLVHIIPSIQRAVGA